MKRLSLIVSVLESYEVVRRQLLNFKKTLTSDCELILVDDGSEPSLKDICDSVKKTFDFTLYFTGDRRPWTQPRARNIGASLANADKLLFFDIDHIITDEIIENCLDYQGDKMHWFRRPGILDEEGNVVVDRRVLVDFGLTEDPQSVHLNSFMIRKEIFEILGGYDERFCGRYGGDDVEFNQRYKRFCQSGLAMPGEVWGEGYVFPNPMADKRGLFHSLKR